MWRIRETARVIIHLSSNRLLVLEPMPLLDSEYRFLACQVTETLNIAMERLSITLKHRWTQGPRGGWLSSGKFGNKNATRHKNRGPFIFFRKLNYPLKTVFKDTPSHSSPPPPRFSKKKWPIFLIRFNLQCFSSNFELRK